MSILDQSLDDLADLPSNKPFPEGAHWVQLYFNINRKNKDKPQPIVKMEYISTEEMSNPEAEMPKPKDTSTIFFHLFGKDGEKNDYGIGQTKQLLKWIEAASGGALVIPNMISGEEQLGKNGIKACVVTKVQQGKDGFPAKQVLENVVALG